MKIPRSVPIGLAIFVAVSAFIFNSGRDVGVTNDAPGWIIIPSLQEGQWIKSVLQGNLKALFNKEFIDKAWTIPESVREFEDQTQPPIARIWFWWGFNLFGKTLGLIEGYRLGMSTVTGLFLAILTPWLWKRYGWISATATAIMLLLSPRIFVNMQYLSWDMPVTVFVVLGTLAFYRGITTQKWALFFVLYGLSLATKLNGLFFPIPLLLWAGWYYWKNKGAPAPNPFHFIILGGAIAGGVLIFSWPDLWKNPIYRLAAYLYQFTSPRGACLYLGEYFGARSAFDFVRYATPMHYPFVIFLTSTPLPVLIGLAAGIVAAFRKNRADPVPTLLGISGLFWLLLLAQAGGFAGERSMLTGIVFLTILAGIGFGAIVQWLAPLLHSNRIPQLGTALLVALAVCLGFSMRSVFPHGLVYFNPILGGTRGALERYGMESAYWTTYLNPSLWDFLNKESAGNPKNLILLGMVTGSPSIYQQDGKLSPNIRLVDMQAPASYLKHPQSLGADYYAVCTYEEISSYGYRQPEFPEVLDANAAPAFTISPGGVPIFALYRQVDLFNAMLGFDPQSPLYRTGLNHSLGGVALVGQGANLSSNTVAAGGKVFADLIFQVRDTNAVTPLRLSLRKSGQPLLFADRERTQKIKRFDNGIKLNPDYGQPVHHDLDVMVYPDLGRSLQPMMLGSNRVYKLRVPIKIPRETPPGQVDLVLTDASDVRVLAAPVTTLGTLTIQPPATASAHTRLGIGFLAFFGLTGGFYALSRRATRSS